MSKSQFYQKANLFKNAIKIDLISVHASQNLSFLFSKIYSILKTHLLKNAIKIDLISTYIF